MVDKAKEEAGTQTQIDALTKRVEALEAFAANTETCGGDEIVVPTTKELINGPSRTR